MRILVTGVNGFVGSHIFRFLKEKKNDVYGVYRSGSAFSENCHKTDLTNETETHQLFNVLLKDKIDIVIHTASAIADINNLNNLAIVFENSKMAQNIANAVKNTTIQHLINFSSSSVYPNIDGVFSETSELDPSKNSDCFYGLSKLNAEVIFNYTLGNSLIKLLHLRIGVIYGKGMNVTRLIPTLENELALKNTLTLYGNGERYINQINIEKLCHYVDLFARQQEQGVFNVGDEFITTKEIANKIMKEKGNHESEIILFPQGNRSTFKLDITKLQNWVND